MTERDYDRLLETVQNAINPYHAGKIAIEIADLPAAANDNDVEWPLMPFPDGWYASP